MRGAMRHGKMKDGRNIATIIASGERGESTDHYVTDAGSKRSKMCEFNKTGFCGGTSGCRKSNGLDLIKAVFHYVKNQSKISSSKKKKKYNNKRTMHI